MREHLRDTFWAVAAVLQFVVLRWATGRLSQGNGLCQRLLDAGQRLPVHVHPTRDYASRHLGCAYGKTEAWYVLEAGPDAAVWVGWRDEQAERRKAAGREEARFGFEIYA